MVAKPFFILFILITATCLLISCQKELDGTLTGGVVTLPANQKPKMGTQWVYLYTTYYSFGGVLKASTVTYRIVNEEVKGGEKWYKVNELGPDTTVFYLREKPDGLYQYTNNNAYLFFKYPAVLNDTYSTYNAGVGEIFAVKGVDESLFTGLGQTVVDYYEGNTTSNGNLRNKFWYNDKVWIARWYVYNTPIVFGAPVFRYSTLFLQSIAY